MQIIHCDLALRNVMVNKFPWEVKVAEFGLARDLTRMASRRSSRWRNPRVRWQYAHTASFSHSPRTALQHIFKFIDLICG